MVAQKETRRPSSRTMKEEVLRKDLERFRQKAPEFGASAAEVIPASYVVVDERVRMKCFQPKCGGIGRTPYCPPLSPEPDFMRKVFSRYRWAVLFKRDVPVGNLTERPSASEFARNFHLKTCEITARLESYAQNEGYDLAMGFDGGTCWTNLCRNEPCTALAGGNCRFPLRARMALEGASVDVFDLCNKVGWDVYMIRLIEPDPSVIPCATGVGIVCIY